MNPPRSSNTLPTTISRYALATVPHHRFCRIGGRDACRTLIDFRNLYKATDMTAVGLDYYPLGRRPHLTEKARITEHLSA